MKKAVFLILIALTAFNVLSVMPNLAYAQDTEPETSFETVQNSPDISASEYVAALPISKTSSTDIIPPSEQTVAPLATVEYIELQPTKSGEFIIANQWDEDIDIYKNGDFLITLTPINEVSLSSSEYVELNLRLGDVIRIYEVNTGVTFRQWHTGRFPIICGEGAHLTYLPPMSSFTADEDGEIAGDDFFHSFNSNCSNVNFYSLNINEFSIVSYPEGSFDVSKITTAGDSFFESFGPINQWCKINSLPVGSFRLDNMTTVGKHFFFGFNHYGCLRTLPDGSFNTANIRTAGDGYFYVFNSTGRLTYAVGGVKIKVPDNYAFYGVSFYIRCDGCFIVLGASAGEIFDSYATPSSTTYYHTIDHFGQRTVGDTYDMVAEIDGADIDFITLVNATTYELIPSSAYTLSSIGVATFITLNSDYILANHDDIGLHTFIAFYNDGYSSDLINLSVIPKAISPPSGGETDEVSPPIVPVVSPSVNNAVPTISPAPAGTWLSDKSPGLAQTGSQITTALLVVMLLVWGGTVGNKCHIQNNGQNLRF